MKINKDTKRSEKSEIIEQMPMACADENTAVEFFEKRLWKGVPKCAHCQSTHVYQMVDGKTGERNKRFLWRCHDCKKQFTVRIGTVLEESRIPFRHWAYAFWRASTSKKGVSAKEIQRQCQISYEAALFLMHRIRFAMNETVPKAAKLEGTIEVDETYVGGSIRPDAQGNKAVGTGYRVNTNKTPVVAAVERQGKVRTKVVTKVTQKNLFHFIESNIRCGSVVNTDQHRVYPELLRYVVDYPRGRHEVVNHGLHEYARRNADGSVTHTNTAESFFAVMKRGLNGIYHAVSKEHLHRYCAEYEFRWNGRNMNDGERTVLAVESAAGKRLDYKTCIA